MARCVVVFLPDAQAIEGEQLGGPSHDLGRHAELVFALAIEVLGKPGYRPMASEDRAPEHMSLCVADQGNGVGLCVISDQLGGCP